MVSQAKRALGNVAAATTGSSQKTEDGQQSAAPVAAPGAVLVSTCPGYILHGNDVSLAEMQQHIYNHPTLSGISPDMVAAVKAVQMQYLQMKAAAVAAVQVGAEPPPEGIAGELQQMADRQEGEEDPLTSDDGENEARDANKKE